MSTSAPGKIGSGSVPALPVDSDSIINKESIEKIENIYKVVEMHSSHIKKLQEDGRLKDKQISDLVKKDKLKDQRIAALERRRAAETERADNNEACAKKTSRTVKILKKVVCVLGIILIVTIIIIL